MKKRTLLIALALFAPLAYAFNIFGLGTPSTLPAQTNDTTSDVTQAEAVELPTEGKWNFVLGGGNGEISCLTMPSIPLLGSGPAFLHRNSDGGVIALDIEDRSLAFRKTPNTPDELYSTLEMLFPVQSKTGVTRSGVVRFAFNEVADSSINGTLLWDNRMDCTAQYPFSLTLTDPNFVQSNLHRLAIDNWTIQYQGIGDTCGENGEQIGITSFTDLPESGMLTLVEDGVYSLAGLTLNRIGQSNDYIVEGFTPDLPLVESEPQYQFANDTFETVATVTADSESHFSGMMTVHNENECTTTLIIDATRVY